MLLTAFSAIPIILSDSICSRKLRKIELLTFTVFTRLANLSKSANSLRIWFTSVFVLTFNAVASLSKASDAASSILNDLEMVLVLGFRGAPSFSFPLKVLELI